MSFLKKNAPAQSGEKKASFNPFASYKTRSFRVGGYSVFAAAMVIAIAVVVNVFVSMLPTTLTQPDITSDQLYSLSEQTEQIVTNLEDDVTIYWVVQSGYENSTIQYMLNRYKSLSDKVTVTKLDPDVYPTLITSYLSSSDSLYNNSLIVISGDDSRYISYYSIFVTEYDYSTYYTTGSISTTTSFAGESELTSAINILTSGETAVISTLTGHGESDLDSSITTITASLEKENIVTESLSLLTVDEVPEDATAVVIMAPSSDISEDEADKLLAYLGSGGALIVLPNPPTDGEALTNLESVMAYYGMEAVEGIVIEGDANYYLSGYPFYLLPEENSHDITDPLIDSGYYVLMYAAQGLTVSDDLRDGVSVTQLLTTTSEAFSKLASYSMTTYEKEDGDIDGPFALAIAAQETNDDGSEAKVIWISSAYLLNSSFNEAVSGGNEDFFLNTIDWVCGETDSISIRAKELTTDYLTIPSGTSSMLAVFMIGIIPLAYLAIGIVTRIRRKRQ